jgi:hypothetical protein
MYPDESLIRDLGRISLVERQAGYRLDAPRGEHGHADRGMALAMGLPCVRQAMRSYVSQGRSSITYTSVCA